MIHVENKRTYRGPGVYVGRPSSLGNPWRVPRGYNHATDPDGVLEKYRAWLLNRLAEPSSFQSHDMSFLVRAARQGDLVLICWCAPKRCHADVIREEIERRAAAEEGR